MDADSFVRDKTFFLDGWFLDIKVSDDLLINIRIILSYRFIPWHEAVIVWQYCQQYQKLVRKK
jgi:hypothetical protein